MSVMMINVKSSKDFRSGIQNGFWGIKYLIVIGGFVGAVRVDSFLSATHKCKMIFFSVLHTRVL